MSRSRIALIPVSLAALAAIAFGAAVQLTGAATVSADDGTTSVTPPPPPTTDGHGWIG